VSWKGWAERGGEWVGKESEFRDKLKVLFDWNKGRDGVEFRGLKFKPIYSGPTHVSGPSPARDAGESHPGEPL
jgi:hypothetical protein